MCVYHLVGTNGRGLLVRRTRSGIDRDRPRHGGATEFRNPPHNDCSLGLQVRGATGLLSEPVALVCRMRVAPMAPRVAGDDWPWGSLSPKRGPRRSVVQRGVVSMDDGPRRRSRMNSLIRQSVKEGRFRNRSKAGCLHLWGAGAVG